jgi:hypothetical protein
LEPPDRNDACGPNDERPLTASEKARESGARSVRVAGFDRREQLTDQRVAIRVYR